MMKSTALRSGDQDQRNLLQILITIHETNAFLITIEIVNTVVPQPDTGINGRF